MKLSVTTNVHEESPPSPQTPPQSASAEHQDPTPSSTSSPTRKLPKSAIKQASVRPLARPSAPTTPTHDSSGDDATWGANFWVTLVDPQSQTSFYACPATGQVSWDPPVGTFVLPPSEDGEWWELSDESRGGLPYYYQTKTGETKWERPSGFVIPLGILQNTAAGRRLSQTTFDHFSKLIPNNKRNANAAVSPPSVQVIGPQPANGKYPVRKSISVDPASTNFAASSNRHIIASAQLTPIPGSPNVSHVSGASSVASDDSKDRWNTPLKKESPSRKSRNEQQTRDPDSPTRPRSKSTNFTSVRPQPPTSLAAALEILSTSQSESGHGTAEKGSNGEYAIESGSNGYTTMDDTLSTPSRRVRNATPSPSRPVPEIPKFPPLVGGKPISGPILNPAATFQMSPVKNRANGKPITVEPSLRSFPGASLATLNSGLYPTLPLALASDIQQFSESEYARQYFSTHRTGFLFKRRVPVAQLMVWQKAPLTSPLLLLKSTLQRDAVKIFKVIQHIMGDRERERVVNVRLQPDAHVSMINSINASTLSLSTHAIGLLEEERWLLAEGLKHGELRDEIYCQLMKQLTSNPSKESAFRGWQLLCVLLITFPPSKNFETYLQAFIQKHTTQQEGRIDVMAKYCLRRLASISKKGPRGKPPMIAEIETASDAAFNPSTFGESLDAIIRLQERSYPHQKIPIILPFLADGILALGGTKAEGIFRVPGDNDSVSALKLRIDKGYYTLDSVDDPHVLASLIKLWLRELCDPLIPEELYNECVEHSKEPEACIQIVERLPTINRRVVLFVISFLQIFLEEHTQAVTKMTPANLALVMAPNLLRCNSDSMAVVFTNAQYEQIFVYNLLLYLHCDDVDPDYKPVHGLGAVANIPSPKKPRNRSRRRE